MRRALIFAFALLAWSGIARADYEGPIPPSSSVIEIGRAPYGAACDGVTDDTATFNTALAALSPSNGTGIGGTIVLPYGKTCLISGALIIPYFLNHAAPSTLPTSAPVRITGAGGSWMGYLRTVAVPAGSSTLDLRYTGGDGLHPAKIDARGSGKLEIDHLTLKSGGSDSFPMVQVTNTTLYLHDVAILGNQSCSAQSCAQDAVILGGSFQTQMTLSMSASTTATVTAIASSATPLANGQTVYDVGGSIGAGGVSITSVGTCGGVSPTLPCTMTMSSSLTVASETVYAATLQDDTANSGFQGYGTIVERNFFDHVRHAVQLGYQANDVKVKDNTISTTCGSAETLGAPFVINAPAYGITFSGNLVEVTNYKYGFASLTQNNKNNFISNGIYDNGGYTAGMVYMSAASTYNTALPGFWDDSTYPGYFAGPGAALNSLFSGSRFGTTTLSQGLVSGGAIQSATLKGVTSILSTGTATPTGANLTIDTGSGGSFLQFRAFAVQNKRWNDGTVMATVIPGANAAFQSNKLYNGSSTNAIPTAATAGAGTIALVSDGKAATTAGTTYAAGDGTATRMVVSDGTNWNYP